MGVFRPATRRRPRSAGFGDPTAPHDAPARIRGLCHWADEAAGHLGAESPYRAGELSGPQAPGNQARLVAPRALDRAAVGRESVRSARARGPAPYPNAGPFDHKMTETSNNRSGIRHFSRACPAGWLTCKTKAQGPGAVVVPPAQPQESETDCDKLGRRPGNGAPGPRCARGCPPFPSHASVA